MTRAEALAVAFEERRAELRRYREWFATNPIGRQWSDYDREFAIRLDELDRLALSAQVGEMSHGCPADYLGADGCTCGPRVAQVVGS